MKKQITKDGRVINVYPSGMTDDDWDNAELAANKPLKRY
jgi:hypothetical protein